MKLSECGFSVVPGLSEYTLADSQTVCQKLFQKQLVQVPDGGCTLTPPNNFGILDLLDISSNKMNRSVALQLEIKQLPHPIRSCTELSQSVYLLSASSANQCHVCVLGAKTCTFPPYDRNPSISSAGIP